MNFFADLFPPLAALAFGGWAWLYAKHIRAQSDRRIAKIKGQEPAE